MYRLKSGDNSLLTKVRRVKAMVFLLVMYGCESWTIKKGAAAAAAAKSLQSKWLMLSNCGAGEVLWTARISNRSILKEINPEYSLEGLMPKLKLQYFGHLMQRADSLEKTLMLGKIEGMRRRGQQRIRWFDGITDSMDMSLGKDREVWCAAVHRDAKSWTWPSNWIRTKKKPICQTSFWELC